MCAGLTKLRRPQIHTHISFNHTNMPTPSGGKTQTQHNAAEKDDLRVNLMAQGGGMGKGGKKEKTRLKGERKAGN